MPIGSSVRIVSVHVKATMLVLAIMIPGSYPCAALAAYSFHHSTGADEWRNTSTPSWIERQSDVLPALDDIRPQVVAELRRRAGERALRAYLDDLRANAAIVVAEPPP